MNIRRDFRKQKKKIVHSNGEKDFVEMLLLSLFI